MNVAIVSHDLSVATNEMWRSYNKIGNMPCKIYFQLWVFPAILEHLTFNFSLNMKFWLFIMPNWITWLTWNLCLQLKRWCLVICKLISKKCNWICFIWWYLQTLCCSDQVDLVFYDWTVSWQCLLNLKALSNTNLHLNSHGIILCCLRENWGPFSLEFL